MTDAIIFMGAVSLVMVGVACGLWMAPRPMRDSQGRFKRRAF